MRSGVLAVLLTISVTTGCDLPGGDPSPDGALGDLTGALSSGGLDGVAVEGQADADKQAKEILAGMADFDATVTAGEAETDGDRAEATLRWRWDLDGQTWEYDAPAALRLDGETWQVEWDPTMLEPSLKEGERLDTTTLLPRRGDILGAGDTPIVTQRPVVRFGIDKTKVGKPRAVSSARALAEKLDIDVAAYAKRVKQAGDKAFVEALVMRAPDAQRVTGIGALPGAVALGTEVPLAPTREFAAPILGGVGPVTAEMIEKSDGELDADDVVGLSGLQARYDEQLAGTAGIQVEAVIDDGQQRTLFETGEKNGTPLRTTLDLALQERAERILAGVGTPSGLVALRPSTGAVLAAASGPGSKGYNTATFAQYAPGSTFKVVTALALLRSGLTPASPVDCPPTLTVDGKGFKNYDDYPSGSLGGITLAEAIAQSCNTALIGERDRLEKDTLGEAAASLGLGVDHDLGFPAYFGQVPPPESETGAAASMIGQGTVLASPMAMAAVMASVVQGEAVLPVLLPGHEVEQSAPKRPLSVAEARALRTMLSGVVSGGSGAGLSDVPGAPVLAKTGTAEFGTGDDLETHAWMIAAQGDLAVAVFVEVGESGSQTAGPLIEAFLRG